MTTRPDPPPPSDGDGKAAAASAAARSYSLASAPLRLLSHSFHSTANGHSSSSTSHGTHTTTELAQSLVDFDTKHPTLELHVHPPTTSLNSEPPQSNNLPPSNYKTTESIVNPKHSLLLQSQPPSLLCEPSSPQILLQQQQLFQDGEEAHGSLFNNSNSASINDEADWAHAQHQQQQQLPSRKIVRLEDHMTSIPFTTTITATTPPSTTVPTALVSSSEGSVAVVDSGLPLLERLLLPYDIRYSIFGQLTLQDIYHCQLVSQ